MFQDRWWTDMWSVFRCRWIDTYIFSIFDVTNDPTFESFEKLMEESHQRVPLLSKHTRKCSTEDGRRMNSSILIDNKLDIIMSKSSRNYFGSNIS